MSRSRSRSTLIVLALVAGASVAGACTGGTGDGPNSTITAPPYIPTPSPSPNVEVVPSSITFAPGSDAPQQVTLEPPNPSMANIAVVGDTCTPKHIASAEPSPLPTSNPSSPSPSDVYTIVPGSVNGTCAFTFKDEVSDATGTLSVQNNSAAKQR